MKVTVHLKQRSWDGSGSAHSKIRETKRLNYCTVFGVSGYLYQVAGWIFRSKRATAA